MSEAKHTPGKLEIALREARIDARINLVRDALIKCHGLYVSDSEIRTLLTAIDKVGVPLPAARTVTLERHSLFHDDAHALVQHAQDSQDYPGPLGLRASIPDPCDCRGGVCKGVLSNGLTEDQRRCKAHCQGD